MKTKTIVVCDAVVYSIACTMNDSADVRCGGPPVLGYDFGVSPDEDEAETTKFLLKMIKKYHRPLIGISHAVQKDFPVEHLWTRERMEECIKNNSF
jgi:hypothetical protein